MTMRAFLTNVARLCSPNYEIVISREAEREIHPTIRGAEGMINTLGGRAGGHGLYLLKGTPVFVYNFFDLERFRWEGQAALTPGKHSIVFDFKYDGPGSSSAATGWSICPC